MSITVTLEVAHLPADYRKLALLMARRMRDEELEPHTVRQLMALLNGRDDIAVSARTQRIRDQQGPLPTKTEAVAAVAQVLASPDTARLVTRGQLREAMRRVAMAVRSNGVLHPEEADAIEKEVCP